MGEEILAFIDKFSTMQDEFRYGKCYWFAVILRARFGGELWYNEVENHFACLIGRKLYDVTGEIDKDGFKVWKCNQYNPHHQRIVRDCVELR